MQRYLRGRSCTAASSLALLCHSATPIAGKLKIQNDVNSISAKLNAHIKDLDVLVNSSANNLTVDSSKHVLSAEGLVLLNNLLRVLDCGSIFAKGKTCIALRALSTLKENARAIGSRGGISSLLEICQPGTPNSQALAAGVLRNLAVFEDIKENFVEENAV